MAPSKADGSNRTITSFFKKYIPQSSILEEEIVVASRPSSTASNSPRRASQQSKDSPKRLKHATPKKNGPGRPRKSPSSTSPLSSSLSAVTLPSRERGRQKHSSPTAVPSKSSSISVTPTKSYPRFIANPINGDAEVTPTPDSPYRKSISPNQRVLLSSPKRKSEEQVSAPPPPPPQPVFSRPAAPKRAGFSFSSGSTLSSLPLSSQPSSHPISTTSSSKRVVKGGLKGVTNSDSDTDDSSGEDLPDIMDLISNKRVKLSPPLEVRNTPAMPGRQSARISNGSKQSSLDMLAKSPPRKVYRNSLKDLVAQKEKQNMSDAMIASMEMALEESAQREELAKTREPADMGSSALLAAADSDDEDQERVRLALARTEALQNAEQFHYFLHDRPMVSDEPFPVDSLPEEPWSRIFRNETSRIQACITGFVAELAAKYPFPLPMTVWFADQIAHEPSAQLRDAYVGIVRATTKLVCGGEAFNYIPSISIAYSTQAGSRKGNRPRETVKALPLGLEQRLRALVVCASTDDGIDTVAPAVTGAAVQELALLNIDELVKQDANISGLIASGIQSMLDELSSALFEEVLTEVLQKCFDSSLLALEGDQTIASLSPLHRYHVIASLPANTPRAHALRRRLALECFSTSPATTWKVASIADHDWPTSIYRALRTNLSFTICETTDYTLLSALTRVLDIALGAGFQPYTTLHPTPSLPKTPALTDDSKSASFLFFTRPSLPPETAAEKVHNEWIDAIVAQLRGMMARIKDAGTSHLKRTEAKCGLEGVVLRLEGGVRTRKRGRKSVFHAGTGGKRVSGFATASTGGARILGLESGSGRVKQKEKSDMRFDSGPGAEVEDETEEIV